MTQEQIREIETKIVNKYRAKQADTFKYLSTDKTQWEMCEVIGIVPNGYLFDIPSNYKEVRPTTERMTYEERLTYEAIGMFPCELCGHPIIHQYPIKCDDKRIFMNVGSTCINKFMGAGYVTKSITHYVMTQLRQKLQKAIPNMLSYIESKADSNGWLDRELWEFKNKLNKISEIDTLSKIKIQNIFKKADQLGIKYNDDDMKNMVSERMKELKAFDDELKKSGFKFGKYETNKEYLCLIDSNNELVRCANNLEEKKLFEKVGLRYDRDLDGFLLKI